MSEVIDLSTRIKTSTDTKKEDELAVKELIKTISEHNEIDKMKGAIVILLDEEGSGRMWVHNLTDADVLWYSEMLRQKAIED